MNFNELLVKVPNLRGASYYVLKSWGYTPEEAEHEGRVVLFLLSLKEKDIEFPQKFMQIALRNAEIDKTRTLEYRLTEQLDEDPVFEAVVDIDDFWGLMSGLSREKKELLFMTYYVGYKRSELADELGISINTVKTKIRRACKELNGIR